MMENNEKWQLYFEKWLQDNTILTFRSIRSYVLAVKDAARMTDVDLSEIESKEDYNAFYDKAYLNKEFHEKNTWGNQRHGVAMAHFHDYIYSKYSDWPDSRWMKNKNNKENERFEALIFHEDAFKEHSWKILNDVTAIKKTDKSFFLHRGSGLPIDIRSFFEVNDLEFGEGKRIALLYRGKEYRGRITRESSELGRTRLFWVEKLGKQFDSEYEYSESNPESSLILMFSKKSNDIYEISFVSLSDIDAVMESDFEIQDLETEVEINDIEGKKVVYYTTKYERSSKNRMAAINHHGTKCMVCGFDFEEIYGEIGKNFIEVHHIHPLYSIDDEIIIDPKIDLACICPNCHRMIHRNKGKILTIDELKKIYLDNGKAK